MTWTDTTPIHERTEASRSADLAARQERDSQPHHVISFESGKPIADLMTGNLTMTRNEALALAESIGRIVCAATTSIWVQPNPRLYKD